MNFLDTAYQVLKEIGQPLHYAEITRRGLSAGWLDTKGQTPEASMGSRLYTDTKKPNSRFRRVRRGMFALADVQPSDISQRINSINRQTRNELRKRLLEIPPDRFEALIGELLVAIGFEEETIEVTSYGSDGGVDVRGVLNAGDLTEVQAAVQAKRWKRNIQSPAAQALRGSLTVHEQGMIITTSDFSKGAIAEAAASGKARISLIDGDKLLTLLMNHTIGVNIEQHTVYSLDDEWWGDIVGEEEPQAEPMRPTVAYPARLQATANGQVHEAELLDATGRVLYAGQEYHSPSGAGQVAAGWKSCNGWTFWRYQEATSGEWRAIDELRTR